jgi:hypothetical protein
VANRLRERHGMIAPLEIFFGPVTVAELATLLESESDRSKPTSLPRSVDAGMDAPLTAAQQRYWFLNQFVPDPALYNVAAVFAIDGELDVTALRAAIDDVLCRHDALRLAIVETPAGLRQRVQPVTGVAMAEHDLRAAPGQLSEVFAAAARHEFDLRRAPLLRAELARIADDSWRLCLIAHHIAMDGASIEPLMREIGRTYAARWTGQADPSAVGEPASFTDVARWEAEYLGGERLAGLLEHWNLGSAMHPLCWSFPPTARARRAPATSAPPPPGTCRRHC